MYIEADFQREYHIDLVEEIDKMPWRRFNALLSGLSRKAMFRYAIDPENRVISDPDEAEKAAERAWA